VKKLREIAPSVHQTISRAILRVGPAASVGNFIRVDYHQSTNDRAAGLIEMEENVYAPMFKHIVAEGKGPKAWSLVAPVLPLPSELGYQLYITQVYKDNASLGRGLGLNQDVFTKINPGRSYLNTMQHSRELDKIVKVRINRVLDTLRAPVMPR